MDSLPIKSKLSTHSREIKVKAETSNTQPSPQLTQFSSKWPQKQSASQRRMKERPTQCAGLSVVTGGAGMCSSLAVYILDLLTALQKVIDIHSNQEVFHPKETL